MRERECRPRPIREGATCKREGAVQPRIYPRITQCYAFAVRNYVTEEQVA